MKPLTCVATSGTNSKALITDGYVHESHALILFSFLHIIQCITTYSSNVCFYRLSNISFPWCFAYFLVFFSCSDDLNLVGHFIIDSSATHEVDYDMIFHAFKFFDAETVDLACTVKICITAGTCDFVSLRL